MEVPHETVTTVKLSDFWDPLYDSFDVDLVIKVLAHTLFSTHLLPRLQTFQLIPFYLGPFFTFFIPVFNVFQGARWTEPLVVYPAIYNLSLCAFCESATWVCTATPHHASQGS